MLTSADELTSLQKPRRLLWLTSESEQNPTMTKRELKSSYHKDYEANATWGTAVPTKGCLITLVHHVFQLTCRQWLPMLFGASGSISVHGPDGYLHTCVEGAPENGLCTFCKWRISLTAEVTEMYPLVGKVMLRRLVLLKNWVWLYLVQLQAYAVESATVTLRELPWRSKRSGKILEE